MTNPFPLPRETRESAPFAGDGRATYGPFDFKIWDPDDIVAEVSRAYAEYALEAVTATKVANQPFDDFSVTFYPPLRGDDVAIVRSRRLHERMGDVTRGQAISSVALERELSTIGTVLQELRRDVDKGGRGNVGGGGGGGGGGGVITIGDVAGLSGVLATKASVTAVQALSASIATIAARAVVGGGLAVAATVGSITTISVAAATQADAEAGLNNTSVMTPLRVAQAIAALGGNEQGGTDPADAAMIARVPAIFDKTNDLTLSKLFGREGEATLDVRAQKLVSSQSPWNSDYAGGNISAFHIRHVAEGTALNGPRGAALGASISMFKEGFATGTAKGGEIDALYIVLRQDSPRDYSAGNFDPNRGDGCGILIDAAVFQGVGFVGGIEGATTVLRNTDRAQIRRLGYQLGCIDTVSGQAHGLYIGAGIGQIQTGLLMTSAESAGGYFDYFISCNTDAGQVFQVDRRGVVSFGRLKNDGVTINPSMHMTLQSDFSLGWLNGDRSVQIMHLTQNGDLTAYGGFSARSINSLNNIQAAGTIIANNGLKAPDLIMTPGARDTTNLSTYKRGQLFVGNGGRLRYCEADGTQPKYVYTTTS